VPGNGLPLLADGADPYFLTKMKTLNTLLLLLCSLMAAAQPSGALTAEQIVDASIAFCGGEARIAQVQTSSINYLMTQPDQSTAIVTEKRKTGGKYVQSVLSKTYLPQTTFFDGKKISSVDGSSLRHVDNPALVGEIKLKTYAQIQYGYKMLRFALARLPDKKFENFDCYVVGAKADGGYTTLNFFDKTNFRLLMVVYPNGNKSLMINYAFKEGVLFNSYIVNTFPGPAENRGGCAGNGYAALAARAQKAESRPDGTGLPAGRTGTYPRIAGVDPARLQAPQCLCHAGRPADPPGRRGTTVQCAGAFAH
jgi:hypothetical protein